jgi:nucleoside-diphosphate-sugar epimerase
MDNKKILITGATGFVGANLLRQLIDGKNDIHIIIRSTSNLWRINDIINKVNTQIYDLTNRESVEELVLKIKPQIIFHLAVYGGYQFQKESLKIINTNLLGTINLLDACCKIGFECFINTGSSSEYGLKNKPMSEDDLLEPINDYGIAKAAATLYCQAIGRRKNLPIFTLRLFSPYGYYEEPTRLIPYLIISCLKKNDLNLANPYAVRDFNFIEDVIDAYVKTYNNKENIFPGDIFNLGNAEQRSVQEVFELIKKLTGYKKEPHWGKAKLRDSDNAKVWIANNNKIKKIIEWKPQHNIENGLKKTIKWIEKHLYLYEKEK